MHNKKRGAIELSMTTIIVIVIGITLLSLGLVWIRGIFRDVTEISDDAFGRARALISGIENVDQLLTLLPGEVEVDQGKDSAVKVVILNLNEDSITITATAFTEDPKLRCGFLEGSDQLIEESGPYTLKSGEQVALGLIVKDLKGNLRTTSCVVEVNGADDPQNKQSLTVRVAKKQSLFN